jgi:hypothetical protein
LFAGKGGEAASGDGRFGPYRLTTYVAGDGAQPGEYRVKVLKYDTKKATVDEKQKYMTFEEEQAIYSESELPTPPAKNLLPKKYANDATSGIVHTVSKAATTVDIAIGSKKSSPLPRTDFAISFCIRWTVAHRVLAAAFLGTHDAG